ncbi:MAG: hypothetical protein H7Y00_06530, partial [Fimbriimonadaceae bacterium]|nr:hypothetical protein [Chitinophagales bacterium]
MKSFVRFYGLITMLIVYQYASAQIVGSNVYLKGNFVEIGVNQCGAYGSDESPPAEYHPTEAGLGFVADGDLDGWDEGDPEYCGDYFVPGSPVEGWQIQVGSDVYTNTDQYCSPAMVPGDVISYDYSGGTYTAVWEGDVPDYDLTLTQTTILKEDKVYFVTMIQLCNDGLTDIEEVYYNRNVDPDNDQPWSGDFTTDNIIVSQPNDTNCTALVTSEGLTYGCFLGMGAKNPNARVSYGNFSTTAGSPENVYEGTGGYSSSGSSVGDIANSIAFYIPIITAGSCETVTFAYILDPADLDEALDATLDYNLTVNDEFILSGDTIYSCEPGVPITIEIEGGEDYFWTWTPSEILDTDTGFVVNAVIDETTTISATGIGGICGEATSEITILIDNSEYADAGADQSFCYGLSTVLNADGGEHEDLFSWTPSTGLSDPNISNPIASPLETTTYTLTTTTIYGCPETDEITITVNPLPTIDAGDDGQFCIDGEYQLGATGAVTYVWSPADGLNN